METTKQDMSTFLEFINEDKSKYPKANDNDFFDPDEDFLIGESGGFLFNMDFILINTDEFREMAIKFERDGKYIDYEVDSPEYEKIRIREEIRREKGITRNCKLLKKDVTEYFKLDVHERDKLLKPLRISGEHYNFLNYGRMKIVEEDKENRKAANKVVGFPRFFDSQYWWTKTKEFAKNNGFNLPVGKSRRAGYSWMEAIDTANDANLYPKSTSLLCAYDKKYLTNEGSISTMVRDQLNFYEEYTPFNRGGFNDKGQANGLLTKNIENMVVGYKTASGIPAGYLSSVLSLSFGPNNPDVAIGKDARKIKVEELSNTPNLFAFLDVTEPTTRAGNFKVGVIIGFGTGGSREGNWLQFEEWFYKLSYNAMPFENIWDNNRRHTCCGFFKPYMQALEGYDELGNPAIDKWGNSIYDVAIRISDEERARVRKEKGDKDYIIHCGQYCNKPSEAFSSSVDNMFVTPELKAHKERVKHDPDLAFHQDGAILDKGKDGAVFKTNTQLQIEGYKTHEFIEDVPLARGQDPHGCIRVWYHPIREDNGEIPENLYRISYDPFGVDKTKEEITNKHSLAAIRVRMINNNLIPSGGDHIVATYTGRPNSMEEADKICLMLCKYYNAKALVEVDRGETVKNFKIWGELKRLVKEPIHVWDRKVKGSVESNYGVVIGGGTKKNDGLQYVYERLYKKRGVDEDSNPIYNFHFEYDIGYLNELTKYNPEGNFDRLSAEIVSVYDDKELEIKKENNYTKKQVKKNSVFRRQWY